VSVVLPEAVERAVAAALDRLNGDLEALVDRALAERVEQLVADRLAASNGARAPIASALAIGATATTSPEVSPCVDCGERPRTTGRRICGPCRHARTRERHAKPAPADSDVPRPSPDAQPE
jgi:hypothetical protein